MPADFELPNCSAASSPAQILGEGQQGKADETRCPTAPACPPVQRVGPACLRRHVRALIGLEAAAGGQKLAPIASSVFDTRERPRRLPITLSEHARRASCAPTGAIDVSRCERTAPSREDQDALRTARPALAVATSDGRRRRPTRIGADPSPTQRQRLRQGSSGTCGTATTPTRFSGAVRADDARDPRPSPRCGGF